MIDAIAYAWRQCNPDIEPPPELRPISPSTARPESIPRRPATWTRWTARKEQIVVEHYAAACVSKSLDGLAADLGVTRIALEGKAFKLGVTDRRHCTQSREGA